LKRCCEPGERRANAWPRVPVVKPMSENRECRRVVVIGGGITGLAAAWRLYEGAASREMPLAVTLLEGSGRVGGALETIRRDGFVMEAGADSFLAEKPAARNLAERLGIGGELINTQEQFRKTLVVRRGRLVPIPEGFSLMAPTWMGPVWRSELFSPWGKLRIAMEPWISKRDSDGDESMAAFVTRRLGREVLERVAQPLAGGIYTADPSTLSIEATLPRFVEMEQKHGSLIRGLRAAAADRINGQARGTSGARWSLFLSFREGMGKLVETIAARLARSIRYKAQVREIARMPEGRDARWVVRCSDGSSIEADAVICTAPAYASAGMIEGVAPIVAAKLGEFSYASAATVNLAYRMTDFGHPPDSFGFVVPIIEGRKIIAGSFSSLKFAGRAPAGMMLARVFIGGALQRGMMELDDAEMVAAAREEFRDLFGVTGQPLGTYVRRWPESMPQYLVGHRGRVSEIEKEAAQLDNFVLAGAYLRGVGIPDCIAGGENAADTVLASFARPAYPR
jgi:protoporphyrinogen/coproporphyrinogen III oxidase